MNLKKVIILFALLTASVLGFAQNPIGFDEMVDKYVKRTVPLVQPEDCNSKHIIYLDAREMEEYNISHLPNAIFVGYDDFNWKAIDSISMNAQIVVYCSIGYRSEKIGEKLKGKGFKNVSNLYGGIFNWSNNEFPIVDRNGETIKVHGYSESWSKWLNKNKVKVVTGKKK